MQRNKTNSIIKLFLICLGVCIQIFSCQAESMKVVGRCISVTDADTITVRAEDKNFKIRLENIDSPERGQEYGSKATQALGVKLKGKEIRVEVSGVDKYERLLGTVYIGEENINMWLVRQGWAWQYLQYDDSAELAEAQVLAKANKLGLWADSVPPMSPWDYRARSKKLFSIKKLKKESPETTEATLHYWLNTSSNSRHNQGCKYYNNTKRGRPCGARDGKACGICGG